MSIRGFLGVDLGVDLDVEMGVDLSVDIKATMGDVLSDPPAANAFLPLLVITSTSAMASQSYEDSRRRSGDSRSWVWTFL